MTIEERVEALHKFQEAHEAKWDRMFEAQAKNERLLAGLLEGMGELKQTVLALARIAQSHEQRISRLEDGQP